MAKGEGSIDRKMREISAVIGVVMNERNDAWDRARKAEARVAEIKEEKIRWNKRANIMLGRAVTAEARVAELQSKLSSVQGNLELMNRIHAATCADQRGGRIPIPALVVESCRRCDSDLAPIIDGLRYHCGSCGHWIEDLPVQSGEPTNG